MEMRLCSKANALFVEVCSFDDSTELCVTACLKEGEKDVHLDFGFFIDFLDGYLDFLLYDDGCWSVEYVFGCEEKSWFPDDLRASNSLVFDGLKFELTKAN